MTQKRLNLKSQGNKYAVTGLSINQDIGTNFIAMGETDRQEVLSKLIQKPVKEKRKPYLFVRIFNEEAMAFTTFTTTNLISKNQALNGQMLKYLYTVKMSTDKKKLIRKTTTLFNLTENSI